MTSEYTGAKPRKSASPLSVKPAADGLVMSIADLPPTDTKRWVTRRKADVVAGVKHGLITLEEACSRYNLSVEEFQSWQRLIDRHGPRGLRITRLKDYRDETEIAAAMA